MFILKYDFFSFFYFFFFNDTATTEIYTLSLHDALPIYQQPVLFVMEDLHWVDPTTLELLRLLVDQGPTTRILALFTCRPDFSPPWTGRAYLTQLTVHR